LKVMAKSANWIPRVAPWLILLNLQSSELAAQQAPDVAGAEKPHHSSRPAPTTYFLIVGKGKVTDPVKQQERALVAVSTIAAAVRDSRSSIVVDAIAEGVITKEQYRQGGARERVTGAIFKERLEWLAETATPEDTVVIYTHSHGHKNGFEESQPLGGIVMDLPVRQPKHRGALLWDEYVDLLLKIPAKNVVVLTMSCFSGGLVEYLNSPQVAEQWKGRRDEEGRSLIVLTSQNKDLLSVPIVKDGELINPFTFAVARALSGEADGFSLSGGKPKQPAVKDGKLTVGELIDYVLHTTESTVSEAPRRRNNAKPQLTGSFDRGDGLRFSIKVSADEPEAKKSAQQNPPTDADKSRR
jgi:hypothetical protein